MQNLSSLLRDHGATLLPILAGALAVYFLLPRPRGRAVWLGAACLLAALGLGAAALAGPLSPELFLFAAFSSLAIIGAVCLVALRNPARAAIAFVLVVLSVCGLFLLLAAPFLMAATIIIYAGAIIVTFLFVLMLSNPGGPSDADDRSREPLLATLTGLALTVCLLVPVLRTFDTRALASLAKRAQDATTVGPDFLDDLERETRRLRGTAAYAALDDAQLNLLGELKAQKPDAAKLKQALTDVAAVASAAQAEAGFIRPPGKTKLSGYAGRPANLPPAPALLPAENVAGLGRTLFSDHLLAVELAGTLLLVATVGAIAVTGRRPEGRA